MGEAEYVLEVDLAGRRPPADRAAALRACRRPAGQGRSSPRARAASKSSRADPAVDDEGVDLEVPGVKGRKPTARRLAFSDDRQGAGRDRVQPQGRRREERRTSPRPLTTKEEEA